MLLVGQHEEHLACKKTKWWEWWHGFVLGQGADLHTAQLMQLPLTVSCKSRLLLPFWYQLSQVVRTKGC